MRILTLNSGSSSVKYSLFYKEKRIAKGKVGRIGLGKVKDHSTAIKQILDEISKITPLKTIRAVGHRVVHGAGYTTSHIINKKIIKKIKENIRFAPLHNPYNLKGIRAVMQHIPHAKNIVVFDTAFHTTIPQAAYTYAIPRRLTKKYGIKKYGFHGTSHKYVMLEALKRLKLKKSKSKLITCHLGNGCSITAIKNGKSIDTSMGFTPLEGLVMGTRSGDIDPAIITFLQKKEKMSAQQIDELLNKKSGLKGLCGIRNFQDLMKAKKKNKQAQLAYDVFSYRIKKYLGAYLQILNGADAIVFTGGIGEHNKNLIEKCTKGLDYLKKKPKILQINTDEELMIAKEAMRLA